MSITLADFRKRFGAVNWTSLLVGWQGFGQYRRLVTLSEIDQFASEMLMRTPESDPDVVDLINVADAETDQVKSHLIKLAEREHSDNENEVRKWVVCLLDDMLRELPSDPLYGLLALTDSWSGFDFPAYSPYEVQSKANGLSPQSYYTVENYRKALDRHRQWIEQETLDLQFKT